MGVLGKVRVLWEYWGVDNVGHVWCMFGVSVCKCAHTCKQVSRHLYIRKHDEIDREISVTRQRYRALKGAGTG